MKRLLLPLLAALALPTAVNAEVTKERPAWMVEKLKGCFKYADEKQKNYCIKTYSPYGNPIPENLDINSVNETISTVKSKKINCNSPVWKNKPACKGKSTYKITYFFNGAKFDSLNAIAELFPKANIYNRDIWAIKNKRYVASRSCPAGRNMFFYYQPRLLRSAKVQEMGCMTPQEGEIASMKIQMQNMQRAIRTNALNDASNTINNMIQQQQINTNQYNSNFGY